MSYRPTPSESEGMRRREDETPDAPELRRFLVTYTITFETQLYTDQDAEQFAKAVAEGARRLVPNSEATETRVEELA